MTQSEVVRILKEQIEKEKNSSQSVSHPFLTYKRNKVSVVSLFCGAGGLDLGLEWAGMETGANSQIDFYNRSSYLKHKDDNIFHTVYALDNAKEAIATYQRHFTDTVSQVIDIRKLYHFPYADLYTFGFPCPGFSSAGPRLVDDERNFLYIHCCRALLEAQPKMFVAENVPGMLSLAGGEAFRQITEDFSAAGYRVYTHVLDSQDYGVPQLRSRVILVGVRHDLDYVYQQPVKTHGLGKARYVTLQDAIWDLQHDPGMYYEGSYSSQYMSRNRKKSWEDQSFTIQASARQAPMHPAGDSMIKVHREKWTFAHGEEYERRLSVREAARIQTFPDWFSFSYGNEDVSHNTKVDKIFKQVGNAVPVKLAKHIIQPIAEYLYSINDLENDLTQEEFYAQLV